MVEYSMTSLNVLFLHISPKIDFMNALFTFHRLPVRNPPPLAKTECFDFCVCSARGRHLRVRRNGVQERRELPEQLQVPVHLPGCGGGLRAPVLHGRASAQPRLPCAPTRQSARQVLRGVGVRRPAAHKQLHGLSLTR